MELVNNPNFRQALVLSPLIALYGIAPIYLIVDLDVLRGLFSYFGLVFIVTIFWIGNIWLFERALPNPLKYVISYATILLSQLVTFSFLPLPFPSELPNPNFLYIILSTVAVNSIILLMLHYNNLSQTKNRVEAELGNLKLEHSEAQIKNLRQQLQPHFLFNTLSTLKSLIAENPNEAEDYTLRLSEFLRYSIQSANKELVTLGEELLFTKDYLSLQGKRFGDALQYSTSIPENMLANKVPIFALQILVENALKHNRFTEKKPLYITIEVNDGRIKVSNNRAPKILKQPSGTGLENLNKRYQITCGKAIKIVETNETFSVLVETIDA